MDNNVIKINQKEVTEFNDKIKSLRNLLIGTLPDKVNLEDVYNTSIMSLYAGLSMFNIIMDQVPRDKRALVLESILGDVVGVLNDFKGQIEKNYSINN